MRFTTSELRSIASVVSLRRRPHSERVEELLGIGLLLADYDVRTRSPVPIHDLRTSFDRFSRLLTSPPTERRVPRSL